MLESLEEFPLHARCFAGDLAGIQEELSHINRDERAEIMNGVDGCGFTPLHRAAEAGRLVLVRYLLDQGADPNASIGRGELRGWTPLHLAAYEDYAEIIEKLLNRGANPLQVDAHGNTPYVVALFRSKRRASSMLMRHDGAPSSWRMLRALPPVHDCAYIGRLMGSGSQSSAMISGEGLFAHDPLLGTGKLAAIWFDRIYLHPPAMHPLRKARFRKAEIHGKEAWLDDSNMPHVEEEPLTGGQYAAAAIGHAVAMGRMSANEGDEILKIWCPMTDLLPDWDFGGGLLGSEEEILDGIAREVVVDDIAQELPTLSRDKLRVCRDTGHGVGFLLEGLARWNVLLHGGPVALIGDRRETAVLDQYFARSAEADSFSGFQAIATHRVPDLDEMPWTRVLELRYHPDLEAFRAKVLELQRLVGTDDSQAFSDLFAEIEARDLKEFYHLCRPSRSADSVLKGIGGLLSAGLSGLFAMVQSARDAERLHRFGWLAFSLELTAGSPILQRAFLPGARNLRPSWLFNEIMGFKWLEMGKGGNCFMRVRI